VQFSRKCFLQQSLKPKFRRTGTHAVRQITIKQCAKATLFVIFQGTVALYWNGELVLCANDRNACQQPAWDITQLRSQLFMMNATVDIKSAQMRSDSIQVIVVVIVVV
jgi:hypothetical protein